MKGRELILIDDEFALLVDRAAWIYFTKLVVD